jgi:DNA-binding transcriptional regulator YiaG
MFSERKGTMKAYEIAGKRKLAKIKQFAFAQRVGWHIATLRDVELGNVDISEQENDRLQNSLDQMIQESAPSGRSIEKEGVLA